MGIASIRRKRESLDEARAAQPEIRTPASTGLRLIASLAAIAVVLVAYSNSLHNDFHFDDFHVVLENLYIRDLGNIPRFFTDARTFSSWPANVMYRPLVSTTLAIDYRLAGGLDPVWFHVTQLALLVSTGATLFVLYLRLFATTGAERWHYWAALFAATLFCVHTGNTQTANYISARSELLSCLGVLGGFLVYIKWPAWRRYYLYLIPVALGALAKTPAVMFAPLLLAYMLLIERQLSMTEIFSARAWPQVRSALLAWAPVIIIALGLYVAIGAMNPATLNYGGVRWPQYLATQTWVWVRYVRMFFVPTGLSADTDLAPFASFADLRVVPGLILFILSLVALWRTSRTRESRPIAFGIAWFWIALVPSSTIFPLAEVTNDHRAFFPWMGLTAAVVWWVCLRIRNALRSETSRRWVPQAAAAAAIVILGVHAFATYQRNKVWLSEETLWADVVKKSPGNGRGLMNYGLTQMRQSRYDKAKDLFTRALTYSPNYAVLHVNLGIVNNAMGDSLGAEPWFTKALELDSNYVGAHFFYARYLTEHGHAPEAVPHLEKAITLSPADLATRHALLALYAAKGDSAKLAQLTRETLDVAGTDPVAQSYASTSLARPTGTSKEWFAQGLAETSRNDHASAARSYRVALALDSTNADALNNLGWSLYKLGFLEQAIPVYERAVQLRPADERPRNNLALVRGTIPGMRFRQAFALQTAGKSAEAVAIYRELVAADPKWVNAHYNLGFALMTMGNCREAIDEFKATLALEPNYPLAHLHMSTCLQKLGRNVEAAREKAVYDSVSGTPAGTRQ